MIDHINNSGPSDENNPVLPTLEALEQEILTVTKQDPEVAGQYAAKELANAKAMTNRAMQSGRSAVRSIYALGRVVGAMKAKLSGEYEDWVRTYLKVDPSTAWRWAKLSNLARVQDLDSYKSVRQAMRVLKPPRRNHGVKQLSSSSALASTAANPAPLPTVATTIVLPDIDVVIKQLNQAISAYSRQEKFASLSYNELRALRKKLARATEFSEKVRSAISTWRYRC